MTVAIQQKDTIIEIIDGRCKNINRAISKVLEKFPRDEVLSFVPPPPEPTESPEPKETAEQGDRGPGETTEDKGDG